MVNNLNKNNLQKINIVIKEINLVLSQHGGGIEFVGLSSVGVAQIKFIGHCASCPMSANTFTQGVEQTILTHCDFVKSVEVV